MGDASEIRVFKEPLLPDTNPFHTTIVGNELFNIKVDTLLQSGSIVWDAKLIDDIFDNRDIDLICGIPLSKFR